MNITRTSWSFSNFIINPRSSSDKIPTVKKYEVSKKTSYSLKQPRENRYKALQRLKVKVVIIQTVALFQVFFWIMASINDLKKNKHDVSTI